MKNDKRHKLRNKLMATAALLLLLALAIFCGVFLINSRQEPKPTPEAKPVTQAAIPGEVVSEPEDTKQQPKKKRKKPKKAKKEAKATPVPTAEPTAPAETQAPPKAETTPPPKPVTTETPKPKTTKTPKETPVPTAEATLAPPQEEAALAPPASSSNTSDVQAQLENLVSTEYAAGGEIAICAGRVDEGTLASIGGGRMQAASLIKLYVAGCVYENYTTVSSTESYSGETESLISNMITVSDNDACNTLVTRLGGGDASRGMSMVNQYAADHGFADTHMGRLMLQPNDADDNYTSVFDCCRFLQMAYSGQLEGSSAILGYMKQQERRGKIPAGIPAGVTVGNKTGELSDVENDAAIVYGDNGTYVLCVMSQYLSDTYQAQQFIARTASVVHASIQ